MKKVSRFPIFAVLLAISLTAPIGHAAEVCTGDFNQAEKMVQESKGQDIQLDKLPEIQISVKNKKVNTQIKRDGDSIFLSAKLSTGFVDVSFDVPVQVCKDGSNLTAKVLASAGKYKGVPLTRAFNFPNEVKLVIVRQDNNLIFNGPDGFQSPPVPIAR